jgi:hypothetical protein
MLGNLVWLMAAWCHRFDHFQQDSPPLLELCDEDSEQIFLPCPYVGEAGCGREVGMQWFSVVPGRRTGLGGGTAVLV